ncbi:MAG: Lrp/AsnC family transcriptional regulator [Desulfobulbus sp.]|jgi:DNA-binding Lrp family transcriptional regulator|nr:Lrp/AsnC ligand binding domain-containing protein [Desulfobulbaceae bacterium]
MVTAFILMQVERSAINDTAQQLQQISGISEVYSVSGKYDLVAIVRVPNNDDLADLVTNRMPILDAIRATETMLAFKAYSRHDLEAMFSLGME